MKKVYLIAIICLIAVFVISSSAIGLNNFSHKESKQQLTEEQKKHQEEVMTKYNIALDEIKKDFNIDESKYFPVDILTIAQFSQGQGPISDKDKIQSILQEVISPYLGELPIGSLAPLILISYEGDEVIFTYKEADGTNVLKKGIFKDNKWNKESKRQAGTKPLLD